MLQMLLGNAKWNSLAKLKKDKNLRKVSVQEFQPAILQRNKNNKLFPFNITSCMIMYVCVNQSRHDYYGE